MSKPRSRELLVADLGQHYRRTTGAYDVDASGFVEWLLGPDVTNDFMLSSMAARAKELPNAIRELPRLRSRADLEGSW